MNTPHIVMLSWAKLSQTSMPLLFSIRSTCLIACLVTKPFAWACALPDHRDRQRRRSA